VVLDLEEGKRIAHQLGDSKAVILHNHGLLTVGHSVDEAAWWFITMERSCQAQLLAEAAGTPVQIEPAMAKHTAGQVGTHFAGWNVIVSAPSPIGTAAAR
jgi:ribulose-5-phosphate 4-epimerase/fuculose-1-phosphate aldolase